MRTTLRLRHLVFFLIVGATGAIAAPASDTTQAASVPTPATATVTAPASDSTQAANASATFTLPLPPPVAPANEPPAATKPPGDFDLPLPPVATPTNRTAHPEDPYAELDPDGVPLSVLMQHKQPTQAEVEEFHRELDLAAENKNWLLRAYEQQQQLHNGGNSADQGTNLYLQISSNKALAKLAGLSEADAESAGLKTGADPGANGAGLRKDPSAQVSKDLPSVTNLSKPLIVPLSATENLAPYSAPAPIATTSPYGSILPQSSDTAVEVSKAQEAADLDSPGMTAAKKDPTQDMGSADLTLDVLPDVSISNAQAQPDSTLKAELPMAMDSDQLHKQQTAELSVVPASKVHASDNIALPNLPTKPDAVDPNAPTPVSKVLQINPVRPAVPNPFDILNR